MNFNDEFFEDVMSDVTIIQKLSPSTFIVNLFSESKKYVMKTITANNHPWKHLLKEMHLSKHDLLERVADNYENFEKAGLSEKVLIQRCIFDNGVPCLVLFMPYYPTPATDYLNLTYSNEIKSLIESMHALGIYHGDLHGGNIVYDENMNPIIVDLDTVFYKKEIGNSPIPDLWAQDGFDMTVSELIAYEKEEGYILVPE